MHELVVMPTKRMKPDESEYSVTCVVSPGTEGVKLLMRPRRMVGSSFEYPISHDEPGSECFVWFDDVFVPWERVIQNGEDWLSQPIARGLGTTAPLLGAMLHEALFGGVGGSGLFAGQVQRCRQSAPHP